MALKKEKGILHVDGVNASMVRDALLAHHSGDVVIEECKNGETYGAHDLLKLDAWVLRRTYSPLTTIGYEIKVSRQDFERDQKWVGYLELCHMFYFVCPAGMIRSTDLPASVGLYWTSMNGRGLSLKHKAERHQPNTEKLNRLLIYALMSRSRIVGDMNAANAEEKPEEDRVQHMRDFLKKEEDNGKIAYMVKDHIQAWHGRLEKQEIDLERRENSVKRFEEHLAKLGITWDSVKGDWRDNEEVDRKIAALKKYIDSYTVQRIERIGMDMVEAAKILRQYTGESEVEKLKYGLRNG